MDSIERDQIIASIATSVIIGLTILCIDQKHCWLPPLAYAAYPMALRHRPTQGSTGYSKVNYLQVLSFNNGHSIG